MHQRNRTWLLGSDPVERCRQRTMAIEGGDGSTLSLDFTTGVLDPRLTFSRASSATFVNSSGYVEYAGENLFRSSNDLSGTNWTKQNLITPSAPSGISAPSGSTTDITTVIPDTTNTADHRIIQSLVLSSGLSYTISFYVKPNGYNFFYLFDNSAASPYALTFNLTTNTAVSFSGASNLVIGTPDAAGWRKISFSFVQQTAATSNTFIMRVHPDSNFNSFAGNGTSGILVWGFQINPGSTAQTYYPTTTAAYYAPRFDNALLTSRTNLVLQSNNFSTSPWVQKYGTAATLTSNYTVAGVPDGFSGTATRLQSSVAESGITQPLSLSAVSGKVIQFSLYIKSNTTANQFIIMEDVTGGGVTRTATPVWQRFQFGSLISITKFGIEGLGAGLDISICGAQVEYVNTGAVATAYIPTTTTQVSANTTEPRGLLVEGQATNLCPQSQSLSTSWTTVNINTPTVPTSPAIPDPFGGTGLTWKIVATNINDFHGVRHASLTSAATATYSFFAKAAEYDRVILSDPGTGVAACTFVLIGNGTATTIPALISPTNPKMVSYGGGWYRCSVTMPLTTSPRFMIGGYPTSAIIDEYGASYTGDNSSGVYATGMQVELGSGASSYIPTGASQVTRVADQCSMTESNFTNVFGDGSLGTITCSHEFSRANHGVAHQPTPFAIGSYTATNARGYSYGNYTLGVTSNYGWVYTSAAFSSATTSAAFAAKNKCAIAYNGLALTSALNGTTNSTTGSGTITISSATGLLIGYNSTGATGRDFINACVSNIKFYPTALTAAQLQILTTP